MEAPVAPQWGAVKGLPSHWVLPVNPAEIEPLAIKEPSDAEPFGCPELYTWASDSKAR